jgi:hypothetical protein
MLIVRETFIAKPGMASKLAKMFKESWGADRVLTDLCAEYNTVIVESEYATLAEYEAEMMKYMAESKNGKSKKSGPSHVDMYTHGRREIFRIW